MTATDELMALLDERGVDYSVSETGYSIAIDPCITAHANGTDTTLDMLLLKVTPTQAVEATLGRGTCKMVVDNHHRVDKITTTWGCVCSACGSFHKYSHGEGWAYCPSCGREVVDE